jgi:DNA-binding MarR family transcriptional regulator
LTSRFKSWPHVGGLLALVGRLVQERSAQQLAPLDLSYAETAALVRLWRRDGCMPQSHMIQSLALGRASCTLVLNKLEAQGLIERRQDSKDTRRVVVWLTEAGRDLEEPVFQALERVESVILSSLTQEQVEALLHTLMEVRESILGGQQR